MTTKNTILKKIRSKCLDCCCEQAAEVRKCHIANCSLRPYRFGTDPEPSRSYTGRRTPLQTEGGATNTTE